MACFSGHLFLSCPTWGKAWWWESAMNLVGAHHQYIPVTQD